MEISDVKWNEEARQKILNDADRALQQAVSSMPEGNRDDVYELLFEKLKGQFVDFEPGPDLGKYADAVAQGELNGRTS